MCGAEIPNENICAYSDPIETIYLMASSDLRTDKNGSVVLKRKYGKFIRPVYKFNVPLGEMPNVESNTSIEFIVKPPKESILKKLFG